jgi:hypothetical protein
VGFAKKTPRLYLPLARPVFNAARLRRLDSFAIPYLQFGSLSDPRLTDA